MVREYDSFAVSTSQHNWQNNVLQLDGTALPSLALENIRMAEDLKISGPDRNKAEETIAGALASMSSGEYPLSHSMDLVETTL